jgi:F420-non-reducing hydrogenase small subunit
MVEIFGSVYETSAVIFRQGEPGHTMYIVQSGAVEVSRGDGGREIVLGVLEKGDFFGEMALLSPDVRSATVTATRPTRLLALTRSSLTERVRHDPGVGLCLLKGLIAKLQQARRKILAAVEEDKPLDEEAAPGESAGGAAAGATETDPLADQWNEDGQSGARELSEIWKVSPDALELEASQRIFNQGDAGDAMFVIVDGLVEISDESGSLLGRLGAGEVFGEMAIIADLPRTACAVAMAPTRLIRIPRAAFFERIRERPELLLHLVLTLIERLRELHVILADPRTSLAVARKSWRPLLPKNERTRIALVSLSTCAGCCAVLLDQEVLARVTEAAEIVYCPMLTDQAEIPADVEVAFVDGIVRLRDDEEKLIEARRRSRYLVAWGTCSALGGIPTHANRFEVEELIEGTYGRAEDAFAYYLSGKGGVDASTTYLDGGTALLRRACRVSDIVKVDYYVPGCPPQPASLMEVLAELTGKIVPQPKPVVCGECGRKVTKAALSSLRSFPAPGCDSVCFNSQGIPCLGFVVRGGCEGACPRNGLPCWGCRGPSKLAIKKTAEGDTFEEVVIDGLVKRCGLDLAVVKPFVRELRRRGHGLFNFDVSSIPAAARVR